MELTVRPYLTAGIAVLGSSALIASPIAPAPPDIQIPSPPSVTADTQLAGIADDIAAALSFLVTQTSDLINFGLITVADGVTFGAQQFAALVAFGANGVSALTAAAASMGVFINDSLAQLIVFGVNQTATLVNFGLAQTAAAIAFAAQGVAGLAAAGAAAFSGLVAAAAQAGVFVNTSIGGLLTFAINSVLPAPIAGALTPFVAGLTGLVNFGIGQTAAGLIFGAQTFAGLVAAGATTVAGLA